MTALTLGKNYVQDQPLTWGFLTAPEASALHARVNSPHEDSAGGPAPGEGSP
jgi:hypothetical protein